MADEAMPDREDVLRRCLERRVDVARRCVDRVEQVPARGGGEDTDRRCVAERRASVRDVCVHVKFGILSERVAGVQVCVLLVISGAVPPEITVGEPATPVARVDPRQVVERAGTAMRLVATAERDGSQFIRTSVENIHRVASDSHVFRFGKAPVVHPLRTAVLASAADNLLAVEDVDTDGHMSAGTDRAAPYDSSMMRVPAVTGRHPRDGANVESVQIVPQHEVEFGAQAYLPSVAIPSVCR